MTHTDRTAEPTSTFDAHLARWEARPEVSAADEALRDALLVHHPIMRSETGPFSGCRCGAVKLGQDVIRHVVTELRAALAPDAP